MLRFTSLKLRTAYRYQQSLPRYITCQDISVQQSHAAKSLLTVLQDDCHINVLNGVTKNC